MNVFVTGGTGTIGRPLVARLIAEGHSVRALARTPGAASALRRLGVTPVRGDLTDVPALIEGMRGVQAVFHVAGINEMCAGDPTPMYRANVDGTRNVLRAADAGEVPRLVYTSSAVVVGERRGEVGRESSPHRGFALSHYERSKTLAEHVALAEAGGVEVIIVNPSSVQGPGRATGTGKLILDVARGALRVMVDTNLSVVDIDDCIEGHMLALGNGLPGNRYLLNGFSMTTRAAVGLLGRVMGSGLTVSFLPGALATAGSSLIELGYRVRGKPPPVCREMVRVLRHGHVYDGSKATRELGLHYRPAVETFRRTLDWFRAEGLLS